MAKKTAKPAVVMDDVVTTAVAKEAPAVKTTKPRNSSVPPKPRATKSAADKAATGSREITNEMIAARAYELWQQGVPGNEVDHWCAAERELKGL